MPLAVHPAIQKHTDVETRIVRGVNSRQKSIETAWSSCFQVRDVLRVASPLADYGRSPPGPKGAGLPAAIDKRAHQ